MRPSESLSHVIGYNMGNIASRRRFPLRFKWTCNVIAGVVWLIGLAVALLAPSTTHGQQLTQYAHTAWRLQDGVFDAYPVSLAQTTNGFLRIGTSNALVRFDGALLTIDSTHRRPAFRVAVEGGEKNLHPILPDEIYKIAAEALRNAFRHSQARQIEVEIRYDNEQFRLRVRDDGKGMGPAILSSHGSDGHYGLPGMRETATIIGGKLVVWSEVDVGTEVEVRVPASTAYATTRRGSWLVRKFTAKT
jgi:signal transduction histidine kinase